MKFTLYISTDSKREDIIERCTDAIADVLERYGYSYSIEYDPREIEVDNYYKA